MEISQMGKYKEYLCKRILINLFGMHGSSKKVEGMIQIVEGGLTSRKADLFLLVYEIPLPIFE